ncbi:hypothetical protein RM556_02240 [Alteromonas sp. W364]|uniref:Uncharacterized protein n=1 Tax=Brumicola blandensis TaxID=3075611 RepID=A0AAW8QYA2_9ALTE|nr:MULTISPECIES: hypothetical protein [unclassified Alteromonas]MDT0581570.1 hypothetical protein [Alteromonas sp. W409]MDT0627145.1 hypothetical protein [Alteromonas sp. W364]
MKNPKKSANAEKQRRFREKQKALGKKLIRGYVTPAAMENYKELAEKTGWTDSDMLSNSLRITYAAYKNGQIRLLNQWLKEQDLKKKKQAASASPQSVPSQIEETQSEVKNGNSKGDSAQ